VYMYCLSVQDLFFVWQTMKMEAVRSSETSKTTIRLARHIPEDLTR